MEITLNSEFQTWLLVFFGVNLLAIGVSLAVGLYAWHNRTELGAKPLVWLTAGAVTWCGMINASILTDTLWLTQVWYRIMFVGIAIGVVGWVRFAFEFTGRDEHLHSTPVVLLWGFPVTTGVTVVFLEDLFWGEMVASAGQYTGVDTQWGPAFLLFVVSSYALLLIGYVLLVGHIISTRSLFRWQGLVIVLGTIPAFVGNAGFHLQYIPVDLGPPGFAVMGLLLCWAIFGYKLMDLTPIAKERVINTIDDAVFVLDHEDRFVDLNLAAEKLFLVEKTELLGENVRSVLLDYPELYDRYADVEEAHDEVELQMEDKVHTFELRISPLYDSHGRLMARQFLVRDITNERRRQRDLEQRNEQLERFASVVSHDLRNPLTIASGYAELLAQSEVDTEYVDEISHSLTRMDAIIQDVLTMARGGQEVTDPKPTDLEAVARDAWTFVESGEATLEVDSSMTLIADREKLQRLLENLLRNAIDHVGGDVTITVGTIGTDETTLLVDGESFGFYVADDGPGIPAEKCEKVLNPGYTTADTGTGLGLSIVQAIAEAHDWDVDVTASSTGGARFEITGVVPL